MIDVRARYRAEAQRLRNTGVNGFQMEETKLDSSGDLNVW
jgi:hypothetical protein